MANQEKRNWPLIYYNSAFNMKGKLPILPNCTYTSYIYFFSPLLFSSSRLTSRMNCNNNSSE